MLVHIGVRNGLTALPIIGLCSIGLRGYFGSPSSATQHTPHLSLLENTGSSKRALPVEFSRAGLWLSVSVPRSPFRARE